MSDEQVSNDMTHDIRPLRTDADYREALGQAARLIETSPGSEAADRLAVLAVLIADYERRLTGPEAIEPVAFIKLEMELNGRTQADLARELGSRSRASELLAGRRALTASMADRLSKAWNIPRDLLGPISARSKTRSRARRVAAAACIIALLGAPGAYYSISTHDLPSIDPLLHADGAAGFVSLENIPPHVRQAFLAAEDSEFYVHDGASLRGLARASVTTLANTLRGRPPSGGGTITHQLIKNTLLAEEPRSLRRRVRQLALGAQLERRIGKDRILELYLNELYFGGRVYGLRAAAIHYFNAEPAQLTVAQAATLAALPPAPNALRIDREENAARAQARRNWVLSRMGEEGYLTTAALDQAHAAPLR